MTGKYCCDRRLWQLYLIKITKRHGKKMFLLQCFCDCYRKVRNQIKNCDLFRKNSDFLTNL